MLTRRILLLAAAIMLAVAEVSAGVPMAFTYQGRLTDAAGAAITDTVDLTFSVYEDTTGGSAFWTEKHVDVPVIDGLFSVLLGSVTPLAADIYDGKTHGLTISVEGGPESSPRVPLVSVINAMRAMIADTARSVTIPNNSIDSTKIKAGGISFSDIGANGAVDGQIMKLSKGHWVAADDNGGSGSGGGWTDDGTTVRLSTAADEVGVGLASPQAKLHVQTESTDQVGLMVMSTAADFACWSSEAMQFGGYNGTTFTERMRLASDGKMGLGETSPLSLLHLQGMDIGLTSDMIQWDGIIVEAQDAVLGLYSRESGNAGSAISMAEVDGTGTLIDKWGFARETTGGGSGLRFTYGTAVHPYDNSTKMIIESNGNVGIGTTSTSNAKLNVSTTQSLGASFSSSLLTTLDSAVGLYAVGSGGLAGSHHVGVIGKGAAGTGVLGIGSAGESGVGVIGRAFTGVKGEAADEIESIGVLGVGTDNYMSVGVWGKADPSAGSGEGVRGESFEGTAIAVHGIASGADGRAVVGEATSTGTSSQNVGGHFSAAGRYGKGVRAECTGAQGYAVHANATGTSSTGIYASGGVSGNAAVFRGNVQILAESDGATVLELGEGLDYAEGFDVSDASQIEPGTVLVIDPDHPGQLTRSMQAYDSRVAGIVAGANGLGSGVRLGTSQFDHDVALAGRVYCQVDGGTSGIEPGDLLTTSATPGHAMRADDYQRAQGAILGKAMQRLAPGEKGLILVLVTLQ